MHGAMPPMTRVDRRQAILVAGWGGVAAALLGSAVALATAGDSFSYAVAFAKLPAAALAAGLFAAGCVYLALPVLIRRSGPGTPGQIAAMLAFGLLLRLVLLTSEPALEDDYHRYLWDGAVTAHGLNPYARSPLAAAAAPPGSIEARLKGDAGVLFQRINHPDLKTIYPPVAQAAFALAYAIKPWSLTVWRAICLSGEIVSVGLILWLLHMCGRSGLWAALYWWNPLVVKELANSAHMDAVLMPLVLGAVALAVRDRPRGAMALLGLAAATKVWPIILAPLLLRPLFAKPGQLLAAAGVFGVIVVIAAVPVVLGGLDPSSGFVAFGERWRTNSGALLAADALAAQTLGRLGFDQRTLGFAARGLLAGLLGIVIVVQMRNAWQGAADLLARVVTVTGALVLLSPAQFPWYMVWMLSFIAFRPWWGLLAVTALSPLYYLSFHYLARDTHLVFTETIVWLIWLPVWLLVAFEVGWRRTAWRRWSPERPVR